MGEYIFKTIRKNFLNEEAEEGTIAYMFRNKECVVLNTFVIVWFIGSVLSAVFGG